nr:unnamed protein product [Digitaria exilis]
MEGPQEAGRPAAAALIQEQAATRSARVAASWFSTPRLLQQMPPGAPVRYGMHDAISCATCAHYNATAAKEPSSAANARRMLTTNSATDARVVDDLVRRRPVGVM